MSESLDRLTAAAREPGADTAGRAALRRLGRPAPIGMPLFQMLAVLFVAAAMATFRGDVTAPLIRLLWATETGNLAAAGGQWAIFALLWVMRRIPGFSAEVLPVVTAVTAAAALALFGGLLVRWRWTAVQATLAAIIFALHPIVLYLATSGRAELIALLAFAGFLLAAKRMEAVGDVQSLMAGGLSLAVLTLVTPGAVYIVLPALLLLAVLRREVTTPAAALAVTLIVTIPSLIAVGSIILGQTAVSEQATWQVILTWAAPMHGSAELVGRSTWLAAYGGRFDSALIAALMLIVLGCPAWLLPAVRLLSSDRARRRPGTALMVLVLPPVATALATQFWHVGSSWIAVGLALGAVAVWTGTETLPAAQRRLWLVLSATGTALAWLLPVFWIEPDKQAWRDALSAGLSYL